MASSADYELLTEHFSYPPVSLLDDIINTVNVLADRALDSVERLLLSIPPQKLGFGSNSKKSKSKGASAPADKPDVPPEEAAKLEIENGTHQLETLLNASIDKNLDIFELYVMQNILAVAPQDRPYIRLTHYEGLDFSSAPVAAPEGQQEQEAQPPSDKPSPESITNLRRRLQASQKLNAVLEAEKANNDALLRKLRGLLGVHGVNGTDVKNEEAVNGSEKTDQTNSPFSFLRDKGGLQEGGGEQPITMTTEFTLSQLQSLRSLSASLRAILPQLAPPADPASHEGDVDASTARSWRRERAAYIETSSRKYLESVGGLELGPGGEVRDGEWQGEGRGLSKGEVEGLEKVVAMLGGGSAKEASPAAGRTGEGGVGDEVMDESNL